jgi:flagellin
MVIPIVFLVYYRPNINFFFIIQFCSSRSDFFLSIKITSSLLFYQGIEAHFIFSWRKKNMALRINTNVAALNAHKNMIKTDNALNSSLERLSTGLRINKAADDASGMAIADSLKAQSLGLGQAIRNANDGISITQTADGALEEAVKIVNTIKTKAIQAAQDGQTLDSRKKIQSDIDKLLQEVDILANTTSFNGMKLLSGQFSNKKFQVGASTGETVDVSIASAQTTKVGHVTTANLSVTQTGSLSLKIHSNVQNADYVLESVDMQFNNSKENGMGALADVVNKVSNELGITAQAVVQSTSDGVIRAGSIGNDFKINGVEIGAITVKANDADAALANAINQKLDQTGVSAAVDSNGMLTLSSQDGRAIKVEGNLEKVMGKTAEELSTFGELRLTQIGSNDLQITTAGELDHTLTDNITTSDGKLSNTQDMILAADSILNDSSVLEAGSTTGFALTSNSLQADIATSGASTLLAGSTLASASLIASGSVITGNLTTDGLIVVDTDGGMLGAGSLLLSNSKLAAGTVITTDIVTSDGTTINAGTTLTQDTRLGADVTLQEDLILLSGSTVADESVLANGSYIANLEVKTKGQTVLMEDMTLAKGSTLEDGGGLNIVAGSTIGGTVVLSGNITVTQDMTLKAGSTIASASTIADGSTLGVDVDIKTKITLTSDMQLEQGSTIGSGSILKTGTFLTNDIFMDDGRKIAAGTTLEQDLKLEEDLTLANDMVLAKESELSTTTVVAAGSGNKQEVIGIEDTKVSRLFEVDVTSQEGAQIAISIADSALSSYDKIRADLGSVQNQLTSTINNLSVTNVNIQSAESTIRDVDFAEEAANFSKMQILAQAGTFSMAQAKASSQNVLSLLQ